MKESIIFTERNLTEKVHYVYRVTIDGKYYIGKRSGLLNDLETGRYKTSSKLVHEKLRNGVTFSKIKILQVFSSSKDALEFEKRILTRVNASANPKFLNQHNGSGDFTCKQHTEKTKAKMKERHNPETEEGRKRREDMSKTKKALYDINTEQGRKLREKASKSQKTRFDINTEEGRKQREKHSGKMKEYFNPETEQGRKRREDMSKTKKAQFDKNTESGRRNRENRSEIKIKFYNTEQGRKRRKNHSEFMKERFNPETEEGRKRLEHMFNIRKEQTKEHLQKRQNASILGELMFDEAFIKENFLIIDDKNNQRFLSSVYSKLSGYCDGSIVKQKREGQLSFLHGIKSIKLSEKLENAKIQEIKAIIKNKNQSKLP